jgi:hypothetical protein
MVSTKCLSSPLYGNPIVRMEIDNKAKKENIDQT